MKNDIFDISPATVLPSNLEKIRKLNARLLMEETRAVTFLRTLIPELEAQRQKV